MARSTSRERTATGSDVSLEEALRSAARLMKFAKDSGAGVLQMGGTDEAGRAQGNRVLVAIGTENSAPLAALANKLGDDCKPCEECMGDGCCGLDDHCATHDCSADAQCLKDGCPHCESERARLNHYRGRDDVKECERVQRVPTYEIDVDWVAMLADEHVSDPLCAAFLGVASNLAALRAQVREQRR